MLENIPKYSMIVTTNIDENVRVDTSYRLNVETGQIHIVTDEGLVPIKELLPWQIISNE